MKMHHEQYDLISIIEESCVCPITVTNDVEENKKVTEWQCNTHCKQVKCICSWFSDELYQC